MFKVYHLKTYIPLKPTCWDLCVVSIIPSACLAVRWGRAVGSRPTCSGNVG